MPIVPVYDLEWDMVNQKLVAGTHGRSVMSFPVSSLYSKPEALSGSRVFPNPTTDVLNFYSTETYQEWEIYDTQGRLIRKGICTDSGQSISVEDLSSGTYILQMGSAENKAAFKFIKI